MMANTKPAIDSVDTLTYVLEKGRETDIHVESCATVTVGMKGEQMVDMDALKAAGAIGFTDDGVPILEEALARKAMLETARLQVPISFHEEHPMFISNNGINRGKASMHFEIGGSDRQAEISMVERDVQIALETGASMNVQHISTKEGVEAVRNGKAKGGAVWAEATPHHIALTEEAAIAHGTLAKMNPPLRTEEDRQAILSGLMDGTIDLIATDHAPHSKEEKEKAITEAPSGILGLETAFAIANKELVKGKNMDVLQLFCKMSLNPAELYGINAGKLAENGWADLVVFDPDKEWSIEKFASKSQNSPFKNEKMFGKIELTMCQGKILHDELS
jgi:dihydroorotase